MIPKNKLEKYMAKEFKRHKDYNKPRHPWVILSASAGFHVIMAVILSFIYVQQPKMTMYLPKPFQPQGIDVVFMKYEEPQPNIQYYEKSEVTANVTKQITRKEPKVTPKPVENKTEPIPAWQVALLKGRSGGQSAPGSSGQEGRRGSPGDQPGMRKAGGIVSEDMITKTGGAGIRTNRIEDNMMIPAGKGEDFGAGGKDVSGFKFGLIEDGKGSGRTNVSGRGGSGGSGGRGETGPGQGLSAGTGKGTGGGSGTGIGIGDGTGKGGMGTGSGDGEGSGTGSGKGVGDGGPGTGGYELTAVPRSNPNPATRASSGDSGTTGSPKKTAIADDKRSAIEREGFKADIGKDMEGPKIDAPKKGETRNFGDALQDEINRDLHTLRKFHEDWSNSKITGIPKALQITVVLNKTGGNLTVSSIDFHNSSLPSRVVDDLTKRIKTWKFKSLTDGKNAPESWPVKLNGRISWQ